MRIRTKPTRPSKLLREVLPGECFHLHSDNNLHNIYMRIQETPLITFRSEKVNLTFVDLHTGKVAIAGRNCLVYAVPSACVVIEDDSNS